ncbi:G2F domain protein [Ancylostoma ceylanicum]|uniref:G2F domain protein n=1 Tax=Ancylostoma ceylanicum TaxID=53326 RepID=A0A0D6LC75_9BILA|nr:G2F domain protein [Ancylostoma ceylanicum]
MSIDKTDLHTFITATDGNAYTAVSKISPDLGPPLLILNPIGSIMGWLFADVSIRQKFSGRDIYHYFKATVFVSGTLPDVARGAEIQFPDYEEEYRRERPGVVRSYTAMDIILREGGEEKKIRMTADQMIQYDECRHRKFDKDNTVVLHVKRVHVAYDVNEGIVRYGSRNYAQSVSSTSKSNEGQVEPGSHFDSRHQVQIQHQERSSAEIGQTSPHPYQFRTCVLKTNTFVLCRTCAVAQWVLPIAVNVYPGIKRSVTSHQHLVGTAKKAHFGLCIDLNECERGDHTCDHYAVCHNTDGSFTCQCRPGYTGDGHHCSTFHGKGSEAEVLQTTIDANQLTQSLRELEQQPHPEPQKGTCSSHQQCHQWGECVFVDGSPYGQCRCRGWYVGNGVDHCGPPEEQHHEDLRLNANIPQRSGQPCGHHVCDRYAECMPSPGGGVSCSIDFTGHPQKPNRYDVD